ncbi:MAG: hypothetical protein AAF830_02400 [Pseudomonadota bacterium]
MCGFRPAASSAFALAAAIGLSSCDPARPTGVHPDAEFTGGSGKPGHWRYCVSVENHPALEGLAKVAACSERRKESGDLVKWGLYFHGEVESIVKEIRSRTDKTYLSGYSYFGGDTYLPFFEARLLDSSNFTNVQITEPACYAAQFPEFSFNELTRPESGEVPESLLAGVRSYAERLYSVRLLRGEEGELDFDEFGRVTTSFGCKFILQY